MNAKLKEVVWLVGTREELKAFPEEVQDDIGYALQMAQEGEKHSSELIRHRLKRAAEIHAERSSDRPGGMK